MKENLLGTLAGRFALLLRDKIEIIKAAVSFPENVGTVANDQLATRLVTRLCAPNRTFIDVGAHIGSIISEVKFHTPTVKIIAIEAIPSKAASLKRRFAYAEIHCCAVGSEEGVVSFFVNTKHSGYSSLNEPQSTADSIHEISVQVTCLDTLLTHADVDIIKIDVEGAELGVLRGSEKILSVNRPTIMFESAPNGIDDTAGKEEIYSFFADRQFSLLAPNRLAHNGMAMTLGAFLESHSFPRRTTNYFAVPNERRMEIRDRARRIMNIVS